MVPKETNRKMASNWNSNDSDPGGNQSMIIHYPQLLERFEALARVGRWGDETTGRRVVVASLTMRTKHLCAPCGLVVSTLLGRKEC